MVLALVKTEVKHWQLLHSFFELKREESVATGEVETRITIGMGSLC